ncbi:MSCRAMM family protein [Aquisphaera insulae]|uniref:MSCRAMM family protein n=1 Tax=Aquisphaera insulae TaxID=2712864 RepID=UPI0013ED0EFB|nr:carboxypeptidase-like regulatory domain-containing protein [Aquisphaera insulae]
MGGWRTRFAASALGIGLAMLGPPAAFALITGGVGNTPIRDPGWPKGAEAVFNHPARIAWWEGPPFGGGQWHAECRGEAKSLNAILTGLSRMDAKNRRVYVHDGVGASFWINPNREEQKDLDARIDWMFVVWQPESWQRLRAMPPSLNPTDPVDAGLGPPTELHIWTGGNVKWADVVVPEGLKVVDERLEAHGFKAADGTVIEGTAIDLATKAPAAATAELRRIEPKKTGGYDYTTAAEAKADEKGRWVFRNVPSGWYQVVVHGRGFASRVVGHVRPDGQPHWQDFKAGLARPAAISGRVVDEAGKPIDGVDVRFDNVTAAAEGTSPGRYEMPVELECKTGPDGIFALEGLPVGNASIWIHKFGYVRPGLGPSIKVPSEQIALTMKRSARLRVTVDFTGTTRPAQYIVEIEPEGGAVVGSWGGSSILDEKNQVQLSNIPPGRYIVRGKPNPSDGKDITGPIKVDLEGGRLAEITLKPGEKK